MRCFEVLPVFVSSDDRIAGRVAAAIHRAACIPMQSRAVGPECDVVPHRPVHAKSMTVEKRNPLVEFLLAVMVFALLGGEWWLERKLYGGT